MHTMRLMEFRGEMRNYCVQLLGEGIAVAIIPDRTRRARDAVACVVDNFIK
jgi:hypothetical protein